jgi:hypothetical protein
MRSILFAVLLCVAGVSYAGNVTLNWTPPTECDDGSTLIDCPTTGYEIYMGATLTGTAYAKRVEAPAATATSITLVRIPAGQKCFFLKTLSNLLASVESNRVCVNVPAPGPKAPAITVTVVVPQ